MIRLTLLQFRAQAITAAAALAAFAILLAATGLHLASLYATSGLSGCQPASCAHLASNWLRTPNKSGALCRWQPGLLHTLTAVNVAGCCTLSTHCRRAMF